ncbi:hypothetical protein Tco_0099996 [Tanacetum coccineum]
MCVAGVIQTLEAKERHPINQRARHSLEPVFENRNEYLVQEGKKVVRLSLMYIFAIIESLGVIQTLEAKERHPINQRARHSLEPLDINAFTEWRPAIQSNATSSPHQGGSSVIAALRDSLMASMREEMDRLRAELRNNVGETNIGTMVRPNNKGQSVMPFSRVTKVEFLKFSGEYFMRLMRDIVTWPMYREAILQRFGLAYDDPIAEIKKLSQTVANVITSPKPLALPAPNASWRNKPSTSTNKAYRKQLPQKDLESMSIQRIQGIGYGVLEFLGVGTMFDIFQNIHILYFQYGVLVFTGYGALNRFPLWSLVSAGTDTPYLP